MPKPSKGSLGRGLDALFATKSASIDVDGSENYTVLRIAQIEPNPDQPRKRFTEEEINELADSIKTLGVLQPIIVKKQENGMYLIVAGERRWRASRKAGLEEIPCVIVDGSNEELAVISLVENLQRQDLNPVEEAEGYQFLMENYGYTQEEISKKVGKSRPVVANAMRYLSLPTEILSLLRDSKITPGHARAILSLERPLMLPTAMDAAEGKLTVRDIEKMALKRKPRYKNPVAPEQNLYLEELENNLSQVLGRKVRISYGESGGKIEISHFGEEDFEKLFEALTKIVL